MGALTGPIHFHGTRVASGDVVFLTPRGVARFFKKPFCAIVDARDRSIPYLVHCRGREVWKVPLDGGFKEGRCSATVYRLPGIDKARAATIAARAAERPGEGVHHPSYACGRTLPHPDALVPDAYAAIDVQVTMDGSRPGAPLEVVRGDQDPPNAVIVVDGEGTGGSGGDRWVERGVPKTLPWQKRTQR